MDFDIPRPEPIKIVTNDPHFIGQLRDACMSGKPLHVSVSEWTGMAFVRDVRLNVGIDGWEPSATASVLPTGAPDIAVLHADVLDKIIAQLRRIVKGPRAAVIARTEATRAFNAAKCAELTIGIDWGKGVVTSMHLNQMKKKIADALDTALRNEARSYVSEKDCAEYLGADKEVDIVKNKKGKLRRFYVAHPKIQDPNCAWPKDTLQEAVDHATELCEKTGNDQYVVQIVRVVRKKVLPVVVEVVK